MQVKQRSIVIDNLSDEIFGDFEADLAIVLSSTKSFKDPQVSQKILDSIQCTYTVFCTTSGHFSNEQIQDEDILISKLKFSNSTINCKSWTFSEQLNEFEIGENIVDEMSKPDLKHIILYADGHFVNSDLIMEGVNSKSPEFSISGGIAGDGVNFNETLIGLNSTPSTKQIVAIGIYGESLKVTTQKCSGFQIFGPKRIVTKSTLNILEELDGKPALDLYKEYLGDLSSELPASALYFPLSIIDSDGKHKIRTVLDIDEEQKTMTFAGNIPQGSLVSLMRTNIDDLIDKVEEQTEKEIDFSPQHIFITSCVGRRIVMESRIQEELIPFMETFPNIPITGFYSYGEICDSKEDEKIVLHNQTMVITYMSE